MLDQMQASTIQDIVEPIPFPETLQFGRVTLTNNFQMFLEAIECAIDAYMQVDSPFTTMSARELLALLKCELETIDDEVPRCWRIVSLVGEIIGFLYPTLNTKNPSHLIPIWSLFLTSSRNGFLDNSQEGSPPHATH